MVGKEPKNYEKYRCYKYISIEMKMIEFVHKMFHQSVHLTFAQEKQI